MISGVSFWSFCCVASSVSNVFQSSNQLFEQFKLWIFNFFWSYFKLEEWWVVLAVPHCTRLCVCVSLGSSVLLSSNCLSCKHQELTLLSEWWEEEISHSDFVQVSCRSSSLLSHLGYVQAIKTRVGWKQYNALFSFSFLFFPSETTVGNHFLVLFFFFCLCFLFFCKGFLGSGAFELFSSSPGACLGIP